MPYKVNKLVVTKQRKKTMFELEVNEEVLAVFKARLATMPEENYGERVAVVDYIDDSIHYTIKR
jgi:hypothetical protein